VSAPTGFVASPRGAGLLSFEQALDHLVQRQDAFAAAIAVADPETSVPTCPGWTVRRLAWHLDTVHRWARDAVDLGRPSERDEVGAQPRDEYLSWYRSGAAGLVGVLRQAGPDAECWHFGPKPRTARFWARRQAQETAIHALDAQLALAAEPAGAGSGGAEPSGVEPVTVAGGVEPIPAALAVDGIDEVVTMFFPRQVHLGRTEPLTRSLAIEPDDGAGVRWMLAGDGATPSDQLGDADATLRGPADLLLRVLWQRVPLGAPGVTIDGEPAAAAEVLGRALTP
jgi:hypothetical protein